MFEGLQSSCGEAAFLDRTLRSSATSMETLYRLLPSLSGLVVKSQAAATLGCTHMPGNPCPPAGEIS